MSEPGPQWARRYKCEWGEVVGARVRRLRESRGERLIDVVGGLQKADGRSYTIGFLSRLERGWATPPLWVYVALAMRFEIEPGVLLGPEEVTRPWTDPELTLLRVLRRLGIEPHEAIALITGSGSPRE